MIRSLVFLLALGAVAVAQSPATPPPRKSFVYPPSIEGARVETYKTANDVALKLWVFEPAEAASSQIRRPAIVFFFGGGWSSGSPVQFESQCRYFASRGMVAMTADYRVATRNHVKPVTCVADAKSCLRWIRQNAPRLGVDPDRVVASGGSAGGHLAAAVATLPGLDEPGEDRSVSAVPNALILFNPALVMAPIPGVDSHGFESRWTEDKLGCPPEDFSPYHHVTEHLPPTLILHGRADTTVPFATAEAFAGEAKKKGVRCELVGYEGQTHGFFNAARYNETLAEADKFLVSLGYLQAPK